MDSDFTTPLPQTVARQLEAEYDKERHYLFMKRETARSLKAHIELEQYKVERASESDLRRERDKIGRLHSRFTQLRTELTGDVTRSARYMERLSHIVNLLSPSDPYKALFRDALHEIDRLYHQLKEVVDGIAALLRGFEGLCDRKRSIAFYMASTLSYIKRAKLLLSEERT
jgi:hypothetical protein